ncbi:arsenate reductase (glutaredoxin) [Acinetobacter ursingii]|jgi:arsenate reductase (glutaredoxin)|uniref:Arsenate reductase n=3 Tax=Acinetobacter TaxID=469 RepID=V2VMI4_9GAMM|nr:MULTISPECIES: arsenate reductase (glutaredoxin) [Acinetobacter]GIT84454.1 arsenate reductase [Acinetobacter seohaensis]AWD69128.1 arsenate reductase (glutaredoxin) [Acinetobacter schindleri]ENV76779.1 arsenate reductase (glutaredoxin) [Acinetobacter ursingii DSM 16037 = CIP 107286]EPF72465.1 arsenate reductase (glutaredoxin) [Acinetobacter indicus ANC 4215]ESK48934.1 arsenate reductase (glutaredoxin) [Acinetobacter indicus CIP 110367]
MDQMPKVQIYHNPACGTSRNTLALIRNTGIEPEVIEYLITPPSKDQLIKMIQDSGLSVRDVLRKNVDAYTELNLDDANWTNEQLLDAMLEHPILINRPLVVTDLGTRLCRPSEVVLDILPLPQLKAFAKEDGEVIIDEQGRRLK